MQQLQWNSGIASCFSIISLCCPSILTSMARLLRCFKVLHSGDCISTPWSEVFCSTSGPHMGHPHGGSFCLATCPNALGYLGGTTISVSSGLLVSPLAPELWKDLAAGMDGIWRVLDGSWWECDNGSTLFFWCWPTELRKAACDRLPVFVQRKVPKYTKTQQVMLDPHTANQVKKKLAKVINRGYIVPCHVKNLINFFNVPKGLSDICLIYDGTKSLLNEAVWAPNFFLSSVDSALMFVNSDTWYVDRDLGEMFLNYPMDELLLPFSGVDLSQLSLEDLTQAWMAWTRI